MASRLMRVGANCLLFAAFAAKESEQTDLLRPNGLRDFEAVSGVSREQIRLLKPPRFKVRWLGG